MIFGLVDLSTFFLYMIPISAVVFFLVSLGIYLYAKKKNSQSPGSYSDEKMKTIKSVLKVSSVIAGVMLGIIIVLSVLMFLFVMNM